MDIAWPLFLAASLVLIATPGQDLILVMSRSVTGGQAAGMVTALGISTGLVVHTALATLGLGLIVQASEWLFLALKTAGAAYLVYLGVQSIRSAGRRLDLDGAAPRSLARLYLDGAATNIANPKIAVFYIAFLPQFVAGDAAHPSLAIAALGLAFALLTFVIKGPLALFAGRLSAWLRARPQILAWMYRGSGAVLVGLGLKLALERRA